MLGPPLGFVGGVIFGLGIGRYRLKNTLFFLKIRLKK
jgi:hypothetical protein